MAESFPYGMKTLWEKEKLHSVFKRLLQTCENHGLFGKWLTNDSFSEKRRLDILFEQYQPMSACSLCAG